MPVTNAGRFDDLENKLDKLLEMQTAGNTLMASLVKRLDSSEEKVEILTGKCIIVESNLIIMKRQSRC